MFKLERITEGIYYISFDELMELSSHFMRWQEIYESDDNRFYRKPFQLMDYLKFYSKKNENDFTYFNDWNGFNIKTNIVSEYFPKIKDINDHDLFMKQIVDYIKRDNGGNDCYLIGSQTGKREVLKHEVAHGLFFTRHDYEEMMADLISALPKDVYKEASDIIKGMGYNESVVDDEIQAYFSTGICEAMKNSSTISSESTKHFSKSFREYCRKIGLDL